MAPAKAAQSSPTSLTSAGCCEGLSGDLLLAATAVQPCAYLKPDCTANEPQAYFYNGDSCWPLLSLLSMLTLIVTPVFPVMYGAALIASQITVANWYRCPF